MRALLALLLLLPLTVLLSACRGDSLPDQRGMKLSFSDVERSADRPELQIIVTYSETGSTHSALRLQDPKRGSLFWDPGGVYGTVAEPGNYGWISLKVGRKNDVIYANVPSLPTYWRFAVTTKDTAMEVFEWDLTAQRADEFHRILISGAQDGGRPDGFKTDAATFYCTLFLSDFLKRYGKGIATIHRSYLWPSALADRLRTQHPSRILVFSVKEPKATYISTPPSALPHARPAEQSAGGSGVIPR